MSCDSVNPIDVQRTAILFAADREGIPSDSAARIAAFAELRLRESCGGKTHYLKAPSKTERDRAICEAFRRGQRFADLAADYGISEARVRQIVGPGR